MSNYKLDCIDDIAIKIKCGHDITHFFLPYNH